MSETYLLQNQSLNNKVQAHQNYTDVQALNQLKQQAREDQRAALKPVAEQFEALFVQQIFSEARKVKLDDGWLDGNQGDFYKDWHDKQLAQDIAAKGSLGFADNIVEQLLPSIPNIKNTGTQTEGTAPDKPAVTGMNNSPLTEQALASRPVGKD